MGFLSELTMVQRAGGAGVLVLLLVFLLIKQRQAKAAPAGAKADATKSKAPKTPKKAKATAKADPKDKKRRSFGGSKRSRKGDDAAETPVAEPAKAGRMVPRLPAANGGAEAPTLAPVDFPEMAEPMAAAPVAEAGGMISEPGWPTPGEVWASPDGAVAEAAEAPSWQDESASDDALTALTEAPEADVSEWATDQQTEFDSALGWEATEEEAAPAAESDATWQAEEETFDWTAGDAIDGWATSETAEPAEELTSGEAAWESPEDESASWSTGETTEWDAPVADAPASVEATPSVATAVAEEFSVNDWAAPAEDAPAAVEAEAEVMPEIVWDPVDEVEDVQDEVVAPVAEVAVEAPEVVEAEFVEAPDAPVDVVEPDVTEAEVAEPAAVEADAVQPEVIAVVPVEPDVTEAVAEPQAEPFELEPVADEVEEFALAAASVAEVETVEAPVAVGVTSAAVVTNPATRWASMAPGGVTEERGVTSPVESWARLRPGYVPAPGTNGKNGTNGNHAPAPVNGTVATLPAPEATSPAMAWWDVPAGMESDPSRGRFALGGYALQPGHQVVSGVTFRDGVVPPPSHWVIGPVVGEVAPGTLVLNVDGCLNCRPEDLAVLTDPGFAPTTDGFSLRLAAAATGPFAASGTYVIS